MSQTDILYLQWIIGLSLLFVARDWFIIEVRKKVPNHRQGWTLRAFLAVGVSIFISDGRLEILENLIAAPWIVWFIFQHGLNLARGKNFFYLNPESSKLDDLLVRTMKSPIAIAMFLFMMAATAVYMKIVGIQCMVYGCY